METPIQDKKQTSTQKTFVFMGFFLLFCSAFAAILYVSFQQYTNAEKEYMESQHVLLASDLADKVFRINLWKESVAGTASKISTSELYRLYGQEASTLNPQVIEHIKTAQPLYNDFLPNVTELEKQVAEQAPLLRNFLTDFILKDGFLDAQIVSSNGTVLLSTCEIHLTFPEVFFPQLQEALNSEKMQVSPIYACEDNICVDFIDPLLPYLSDGESKASAALILTSQIYAQALLDLNQNNTLLNTSFNFLVNTNNNWSIIKEQLVPVSREIQNTFNTDELGNIPFGLRKNLAGTEDVYSQAIYIPGLGWWLMAEVPANTIQEGLLEIRTQMLIYAGLATLALLLLLPIIWWFTSGRTQHQNALKFKELFLTIQNQKQFLDTVNLSLEVGLFMLDDEGKIQFCNSSFEKVLESTKLENISLLRFFDMQNSKKIAEAMATVLGTNKSVSLELERSKHDSWALYRTSFFPFAHPENEEITGIVGTMQDITEFRKRQQRLDAQRAQTLDAFLRAVESVDPYLSGHSHLLKQLAVLTAKELNLPEIEIQTISTAAELSQVGKLFVPPAILQKTKKLEPEELALIRKVPDHAYSVLKNIHFDTPVAETVYSMYENLSGTGYPRGISGGDLDTPTRILSVLNVFCAIISPRAYRERKSIQNALDSLNTPDFDNKVLAALFSVLKSPVGKEILDKHLAHVKKV